MLKFLPSCGSEFIYAQSHFPKARLQNCNPQPQPFMISMTPKQCTYSPINSIAPLISSTVIQVGIFVASVYSVSGRLLLSADTRRKNYRIQRDRVETRKRCMYCRYEHRGGFPGDGGIRPSPRHNSRANGRKTARMATGNNIFFSFCGLMISFFFYI